jgi:hypothetical protein
MGLLLAPGPLWAADEPRATTPAPALATNRDGSWARILPASWQIPGQDPARPGEMQDPNPIVAPEPLPLMAKELTPDQMREVDEQLLRNIQLITNPEERVLALVRAGRYKIGLRQYDVAKNAFDRAGETVGQITDPLRRDLRIAALMEGLAVLADEQVGEGVSDSTYSLLPDAEDQVAPERRLELIDGAIATIEEAGRFALQLQRPAYHREGLYAVAEIAARMSQNIAASVNTEGAATGPLDQVVEPLRERADRLLVWGVDIARQNPSGPWRDRGLVVLASSAAGSNQFERGMEIARSIPTPEIRGDALIRLAEAESRRGTAEDATAAYGMAAEAIASIPITDLRATLTDVLVDSMIAAGRFTDARRATSLYPLERERLAALGAVAKSMGERNLGDRAREWINSEVPEHLRDRLLREVSDGVLLSLESYRSETFLRGPRN